MLPGAQNQCVPGKRKHKKDTGSEINGRRCLFKSKIRKTVASVAGGSAVQNFGFQIRDFMRRVRIFDPVKNLKRQAGAELLIEDLNGSQIFCQKILDIVVKAGYGNVLRHAQSPLFKKLHQNTGNVVAGADKSVRHAGKGGKERIDFLAVGVNPKRCGQAKRRIRCFPASISAWQKPS